MGKKEKGDSKVIQKNGKKNQKMEKVKKAVKAGLIETPEPTLVELVEMPVKNKGNKKSKSDKKVVEEPIVESDEGSEVESDEEAEVESDEEAEVESDEDEVQNESDEEETQSDEEAPDEIKIDREKEEEAGEAFGYTILVNNLQPTTTREEIIKLFNSYGKVVSVLFQSCKGITYNPIASFAFGAFVVFDSVKAASKALEVNDTVIDGRKVKVTKRGNRNPFVSDSTNTIYVGNVNTSSPGIANKMRDLFLSCGSVKYVKLLKGAAFVTFNDTNSIESAFKLNGSNLDGKTIRVNKFEPRSIFVPTDKKAVENLSPEELKEKMVQLGQQYTKLKNRKPSAPYNSNFKGVRGQNNFKGPRKFVSREN